jgi:hypothetical protein
MRQLISAQPRKGQTRTYSVTERSNLFSTLVCLGAGALGATVLSLVSGALAYVNGALVVRDERAMVMAIAVGVIDIVLMGLFKANLFDDGEGDVSVLPLYIASSGLGSRRVHPPVHFGPSEVRMLKQLAEAR